MNPPPRITAQTEEKLLAFLTERGHTKFRVQQIMDWVWRKRVASFDAMTNLSPALRSLLAENFRFHTPEIVEISGTPGSTRKFLTRMEDGSLVESVIIPAAVAEDGEKADRTTLCVSSQVGCAFGCKFCASGLLGLRRNLSAGEITGQILSAESIAGKRINNLVFMGMGEPLANFDNLHDALEIITSHRGLEIGARHITISTSGFVPGLKKLAAYPRQIRLAVSLHGATDEVRSQIMPVNKKWPLSQLIPALEEWGRDRNQMPTLEYILIRDVNDSLKDASHLMQIAKRLHAKVNLIPYNTVEGLPWERPSEERCCTFRDAVRKARIPVTMRYEKGHDINAACGQLRLRKQREDNGGTFL
ncbi:23S rRNA (adenine(2503)-C(2))-methyltransferase RlmN [Akkermansia sp. BIOML-A49]|uniref:23S rRNA (adenine(2503)-C(2))-methyltransferase RlmN n=1 Tax=Akkermansia sp. BIOML-A49 TaxID=2584605 RepID=UPI00122EF057|nr:23S rRNA (adenine(2503)-C(2))-methyltransferase RlmN [Akkermansia sp. BIOML-A49]KAA3205288.1 23S rRNA (adenine(2503)-C(2))-methyltransferase RlmN [Akkermansia sp. BIOML-A49]